jgi:hypothetical protein
MNIRTLTNYVNLDVDDSYTVQEISFWFNKGIANYNLIPPLTVYPSVAFGTAGFNENSEYPLDDTFMLGVMLPFVSSSIRGSESSVMEKQLFMQEYMLNANNYKRSIDIPATFMRNTKNDDLSIYEIGEGIFVSDFTRSPFAGRWEKPSQFDEIIKTKDEE